MKIKQSKAQVQNQARNLVQKSIDKIANKIKSQQLTVHLNKVSSQPQNEYQKMEINIQVGSLTPKRRQTPYQNQNEQSFKNSFSNEKQIENYPFTRSRTERIDSINQRPRYASKSSSRIANKQLEIQLKKKAEEFVQALKDRKRELEGKIYLLKRAEMVRKREKQKKAQIELQVQKQIEKNIRKINAQKNIQFFKEKKKLLQIRQKRSYSMAQTNSNRFEKIILPSINQNELQSIKQEEGGDNMPIGLKKTAIRRKKRSATQANARRDSEYSIQRPQNQIKLVSMEKEASQGSKKSYKQYMKQYQQRSRRERKCYLMKRNQTEDIAEYLQKYKNLNVMLNQSNYSSPKKRKRLLTEGTNKRFFMKSNTANRKQFWDQQYEQKTQKYE